MLAWLQRHKQTPRAIERFWRVVLVSALDEELDRTDARFGIDVFWKAFLKNSTGYRMGVPSVPLGELYEGCRVAIEKKGGEVILRSPARSLCIKDGVLAAVQFEGGREESADAFVLAIPQDKLNDLLSDEIRAVNPSLAQLEKFKVSPITGVHFWFDREVTKEPFITLLDTQTQWIFNKSALYGNSDSGPTGSKGQYLQLVISASYDLLRKSREEIIDLCLKEVRQALPAAREAQLVKATVIKEASATFSPEPGVDHWRPAQQTKTPGLFLAGDWTQTGWPATMEGAVRSGYLAAEAVLGSADSPQKFLVPDLPASGLSRLFS
jgi:zeta-carotene desaturase